ncbi:hypothetical protein QQX98_005106 [Neonectria punicea]|uniref:Uncharacterized protein n=1 Tax=Neonectria punicea TaxID=979145 RepID=A0ABR1H6A0_9HYPO
MPEFSWVHKYWRCEMMYHEYQKGLQQIDQFRLRIPCTLCDLQLPEPPDPESIAAFGILILQLQAAREANWDDELGHDVENDRFTNKIRLGKLLQKWQTVVKDDY